MNWDALSAISEIVGVGAVLITLVYLAAQMRQNTASMQAGTRQAILQEDQAFIYRLLDEPDLVFLRLKPKLSDEEKVRLNLVLITFFRLRESNWRQFQSGVLDEATWTSYRNSIRGFSSDRVRAWLDNEIIAGQFDPDFLSMSKEILVDVPDQDHPIWLDTLN